MRLIRLMTFVTALLMLALVPAVMQFARMHGLQPSSAFATVGAVCAMAALATWRE